MKLYRGALLAGALLLSATACGSTTTTDTGAAASADGSSADGSAAAADWMSLPLTDARTGETFTLAELNDKPLYVENFATWCSNCRAQLNNVEDAASTSPTGEDAEFVSLSVEVDLSPEDVASYADDEGFDSMRFAVMSPEMLAAMEDEFGSSALNPPSTPHFYVSSDGDIGELATGYEDPADIQATVADLAAG